MVGPKRAGDRGAVQKGFETHSVLGLAAGWLKGRWEPGQAGEGEAPICRGISKGSGLECTAYDTKKSFTRLAVPIVTEPCGREVEAELVFYRLRDW